MLLLLISITIAGKFNWQPVDKAEAKEITKEIMSSSVVKSYGKKKLQKRLTRIGGDVFKGGYKVLIPKGAEVVIIPEGLELKKTEIKMSKYDRYTALYEEGKLKKEWEILERESAKKMGLSSLEDATAEDIRNIRSRRSQDRENVEEEVIEEEIIVYPQKNYFSFILIRTGGREKLLPVVLSISPIWELLNSMEE